MLINFDFGENLNETLCYIILFAIVLIILGLAIFLLFYFAYQYKSDNKINSAINSCRIFVIDIDNDHYDYFQINKIGNGNFTPKSVLSLYGDDNDGKTLTYQTSKDFYKQFDTRSQANIKTWLNLLVDGNDLTVSRTLDATVNFSHSGLRATVLLEAYCVVPEEKKIYLKSTVLKNTKINSLRFSKKHLKNQNEMTLNSILENLSLKNFKGYTLCYKFYYKEEGMEIHRHNISLIKGLFDILQQFIVKNRYIYLDQDKFEFIVSDSTLKDKYDVLKLNALIRKEFKQYLELNGYLSTYSIAVGAVLNQLYRVNKDNIFTNASMIANYQASRRKNEVGFDNELGSKNIELAQSSYGTSDDIKSIKWKFEPIIHAIKNKKTTCSGYFGQLIFDGDKQEFRRKCEHDKNLEDLFEVPNRKLLSEFNSRIKTTPYYGKGAINLFLKVSILDSQYFDNIFRHYSSVVENGWDLILTFNEDELARISGEDSNLNNVLYDLSTRYGLSLILKNNNEFLLPDGLMKLFTFYVFDAEGQDISANETLKYNITSKAGKTTRYSKNIMIIGLKNWNDLELMLDYDLRYLSGQVILPRADNQVKPIEKRTKDKIDSLIMNS